MSYNLKSKRGLREGLGGGLNSGEGEDGMERDKTYTTPVWFLLTIAIFILTSS
jgi:hypothetical protein